MSLSKNRHILLISGAAPDSKSVSAVMSVMRMAGAYPMLVANQHIRIKNYEDTEFVNSLVAEDIAKVNGVVVMGNDLDICPSDYGQKKHPATRSEKTSKEGVARATYEYKLIEMSLEKKLPMLCICGGMQRLNVLLGGTLHQHVPDLVGSAYHHQGTIAPFIPVQYIKVLPGTLLASISKEVPGLFTPSHEELMPGVFMDNSFHHQAVKDVGKGLIECAHSIEPHKENLHITQAIEADPEGPYNEQFLLGLQWHPEFGASDVSLRTLQHFNEVVTQYAQNQALEVSPEQALASAASNFVKNLGVEFTGEKAGKSVTSINASPKKPGGKSR